MLKVCVKHFIYDFCIKVFFDKLKANFRTVALNRLPKTGEYLAKISHKFDDEHYYNCIIKNVHRRTNVLKETYYVVDLNYQYCDGTVFDDMDWLEEQTNNTMLEDWDPDEVELDGDDYEIVLDEEEEMKEYFEESSEGLTELLDNGDVDAVERDSVLSIRYELYNFYR